MTDLSLFILLTVAIAIGFFLGRRGTAAVRQRLFSSTLKKRYFQGLNYLLNEQPDKAVDAFIDALEVNDNTLETHLALGKLMRKQGQVDRAIRIHQNLLARPQLNFPDQHQVHLELARDFMAAGLLDRAEMLLRDVMAESAALRGIAQRSLIDILQDEREWSEAIAVAESLLKSKYGRADPQRRQLLGQMIAQFYCELAAQTCKQSDEATRRYLSKALSINPHCVRASILLAAEENAAQQPARAIKVLSRVLVDHPERTVECLPELLSAHSACDAQRGFDRFVEQLERHFTSQSSTAGILFLVEQLLHRAAREPARQRQARELLSTHMRQQPSLAGLQQLIAMQLPKLRGELAAELQAMQLLVSRLLEKQRLYRCNHCGFSGRQLHWRCPSCKCWDEISRL